MPEKLELHNVDIPKFLSVLRSCKGNVFLETPEGDKINLKSRLCQLIGLQGIIEGGKISEAFITCDNIEDESKLFRLNLLGEVSNE